MVTIKSTREIELMRKAGSILADTRKFLEPYIKPGVTTLELDILADKFIRDQGAIPSFKNYEGFPGSICTSVNEVVIHGIPSKTKVLKEGDIISIDLGVNYKGYHADSAWTYPVGNISPKVQKLLDVTKEALYRGIEMVKPGNTVNDVSRAIESYIRPFGFGIVEEFTGHGIGKSLHEEPYIPNYGEEPFPVIFKPGMTFCIEPMVNIGTKRIRILQDNWTTVTQDKSKSAHFEHTVLVTETGFEILTKNDKEIIWPEKT
ncbi:type I methionyl aminopeptidase [Acholeplasma equifetale]|jgi:methionyl aminopeptidase|uniref:type I methionyl aminopeptidase n=1 Tax=Acholeplasma equifetale TaxID=264634 RepID=UPI00047E31BE|nr:type I methionyl aminopeptidase [Acholeplasma equifetale]HHY97010.1 type I methionyl aminopeptidase [Acholeplasma sp.]